MRTRLALIVVAGFIALAGVSAGAFGWYGYRVFTELTPGSWNAPTEILDRNGKTIVSLYGSEWRVAEPVVLSDLPDHVPYAFLAAEDSRFRSHIGIDPIGIGRAVTSNIAAGSISQGGSTITQQLARTRFLSSDRTVTRKFLEAGLAVMIELRLSKDEILEAYINEIYLGHRDGREVRGLGEAARVYFGKSAGELAVSEAALITGMIRAPNRDNPDERAKIAKQRRDAVLGVMAAKSWITEAEQGRAVASDAEFRPGSRKLRPHPYLVAAVRQEFIDRIGERKLSVGGLRIHTAVDAGMQVSAELAVRVGTQRLRSSRASLRGRKPLQAALLSVDPATGGIRALVGGSNFRTSQFDRTRLMKRQPGSAAKPFTYAAAIGQRRVTPASLVDDSPIEITLARNNVWKPQNYDQQFRGQVTVREAFEKSLNVPAVRVASNVGVGRVQNVFHDAGIEGDLSDTPAIALGVDDVSMRQLVEAYSIFPNLGARAEPYLIERVEERNGDKMYEHRPKVRDAIDPAVAYVMHSLMRGVVTRGTAARLNQYGLGHVAGKTGTTNSYRDAWFVGYVPDLLTAVWVGFDDGTPLRISSGEAAVPLWAEFMRRAPHSKAAITPPGGVSTMEIEAATGRVWRSGCGPAVTEVFLSGTEPREQCGGYWDGEPLFVEFEEPAYLTDEQWAEWARAMADTQYVQAIEDPEAFDMSVYDDSVSEFEIDTGRVRVPVIEQPIVIPPVRDPVRPPVIAPPVTVPPPAPRPAPPPPAPPPSSPRPPAPVPLPVPVPVPVPVDSAG
ncbi:MAG: transglycosylase domain-containing protein [Gemmatimonadaceae bacterium]